MTGWPRAAFLAATLIPDSKPYAAECLPVESRRCTLELHGERAPRAEAGCAAEVWRPHLRFEQPERFADRNGDGWFESVLRLDLRPEHGCRCAVFRVRLADARRGFALDIGDSPTNDGYGGDAGTTPHAAEVQIYDRRLNVYSTGVNASRDELLLLDLPPLTRTVEVEVCDQFVSFSASTGPGDPRPLKGQMSMPTIGHLFTLVPATAGRITGQDASIWAGFNRVIHERAGAPVKSRFGTGVERVELFLTP